jgi:ParB family transcriptional regulator, chromosome partitioning protein
MERIISVDPFRCRVWALHDRLEDHITEESCCDEIESFAAHGQLVPALGRRVGDDPNCDVELIYGARRLFVARHLNRKLLVELRNISDVDAIVAMDTENRHRKDISPYERGRSYQRWLRARYFSSQDEIARSLNTSSSQVSRLLKMAQLPSGVVNAFDSAVNICESWGLELVERLSNPDTRQSVLRTARAIATMSPRPMAEEVYRRLLASAPDRKARSMARTKVVKGRDGSALFRIKHQRKAVAIVLPVDKISVRCLDAIEDAVARILQCSTPREMHEQVFGNSDAPSG